MYFVWAHFITSRLFFFLCALKDKKTQVFAAAHADRTTKRRELQLGARSVFT